MKRCLYCSDWLRAGKEELHGECRAPWALGTGVALLIPHDQRQILARLIAERDQVVPA